MATKPPKKALTFEEEYPLRLKEGPQALLSEKGTNGKRIARSAFGGSFQPFGPFDATQASELRAAVSALYAVAAASLSQKFPNSDIRDEIVNLAHKSAEGLHSHHGKYLHSDSRLKTLEPAQSHSCEYLSSASAAGMRGVSAGYPHSPKHSVAGKLFHSSLLFGKRVATVAELLAEDQPQVRDAFVGLGFSQEQADEMRDAFLAALKVSVETGERCLPVLQWPVGQDYVQLQTIPSIAVYNAISAMRAGRPQDHKLRLSSFQVGSGNAQNISEFAVGTSGHLPLLPCEPPRTAADPAQSLVRKAHARALLTEVPGFELAKFGRTIHDWPNLRREQFLRKYANLHVLSVLDRAIELRERVLAKQVDAALLPGDRDAVLCYARGESLTDGMAKELSQAVINSGPSTKFSSFSPGDTALYQELVRLAILALE